MINDDIQSKTTWSYMDWYIENIYPTRIHYYHRGDLVASFEVMTPQVGVSKLSTWRVGVIGIVGMLWGWKEWDLIKDIHTKAIFWIYIFWTMKC